MDWLVWKKSKAGQKNRPVAWKKPFSEPLNDEASVWEVQTPSSSFVTIVNYSNVSTFWPNSAIYYEKRQRGKNIDLLLSNHNRWFNGGLFAKNTITCVIICTDFEMVEVNVQLFKTSFISIQQTNRLGIISIDVIYCLAQKRKHTSGPTAL